MKRAREDSRVPGFQGSSETLAALSIPGNITEFNKLPLTML